MAEETSPGPAGGERKGEIEEVLSFWFGEQDARGLSDEAHAARWWRKDPDFDRLIEERFGPLHAAVARGERDGWLASDRGRLALVVVLDQFSRNMFRGTPAMFASDSQALEVARGSVDLGADRRLTFDERGFLYMPFMHAEDLEAQDRAVRLFTVLRDEHEGESRERAAGSLDFAVRHRNIIRRFGRFPHRNALLGRASTPEELAFLAEPGSSF